MTRNQEIANTILTQLGGANRLSMMTGAYNFVAIQNGLSFKIKNPKANYIKITLNGKDLYDLEVGRIRGNTYKVVHQSNDLYFDMLKPAIEKATGMYLSLFAKGGEIGHSVAVKKDFKKISQRDIDLFVDYCYGFYGKGGTYADDLNGGFTKAKVKSAVMKYIKNLGDVDTWGGGDSMDRESVREILQPSYSKFSKGGKIKTKYTIFVYYGGEMEDEVFHTNNLALAKKYAMKGEHAEIMDNESNTLVEDFADGGKINSDNKYAEKLIQEIKKHSNYVVGTTSTSKDGKEQYRYDSWYLKYKSATNWLVKLFEKVAKEITGKSYSKNFTYGDYSFYYDRPSFKGQANGTMQMKKLVVIDKNQKENSMAKGGKTKKGKKEPMIVRSYFEDEPYEYAKGGGIKEDLPKKKRERLDYLQSQEDISSLTPMQNREYEALVREYRKTNRYKKAQLDKYSEGGSIGGFNYSIGGL